MTTVCTTDPLSLRFHHLACLRHFVGEGYSEAFTARMTALTALLREKPSTPVRLIAGADTLCAACPHDHGGVCDTQAKVERLDAAWRDAFGLDLGETPFGQAVQAAEGALASDETFDRICGTCEWHGLCTRVRAAQKAAKQA